MADFFFTDKVFKCPYFPQINHYLDNFLTISSVLSLSHLLLLIAHYYLILTTNQKKKANDFLGLILTAWITSAALGNMDVSGKYLPYSYTFTTSSKKITRISLNFGKWLSTTMLS